MRLESFFPGCRAMAIAVAISGGCVVSGVAAPNKADHGARPSGVNLNPLFKLATQDGHLLERSELRGKPAILLFGYTHCPDVCPTALLEVSLHLQKLGPDGDRINVIFVTVDPERDTVEKLKPYLGYFDRRIIGLTGRLDDVVGVADAFGTQLVRSEKNKDSYSVDHSALIFLIDRYGLLAQTVRYGDGESLAKYSGRLLAQ